MSLGALDEGPHFPCSWPSSSCTSGAVPFCSWAPASAAGASERRGLSVPLPFARWHARTHSQSEATGTRRRPRLTWRRRGVGWAAGREGPGLEPRAPESFWAAGRTLGHGRPSWTLLCPLAAAICNCNSLALPEALTLWAASRSVRLTQGSPAHPSLGSIAPQLQTEAESLFCGRAGARGVQRVDRDSLAPDVTAVLSAPEGAHSSHVLLGPGCPVLPSVLVCLRLPTCYTRGTLP